MVRAWGAAWASRLARERASASGVAWGFDSEFERAEESDETLALELAAVRAAWRGEEPARVLALKKVVLTVLMLARKLAQM